MDLELNALRAVLAAYREVMDGSWPTLHPSMARKAPHWKSASEEELAAELAGYLRDASQPRSRVRVFWKVTPKLLFGGCNSLFAADAGMAAPDALIGLDDFDLRLPWAPQAAKFRADDEAVYHGEARLDIIEQQTSTEGLRWVRAGKAPIRTTKGPIGILGMYEILEPELGAKLHAAQQRRHAAASR